MKFHQYTHHRGKVWVRNDLRGKHRAYCLCYKCGRFHFSMTNFWRRCARAKVLYWFCVIFDMTTPVWECPKFEEG